MIQNHPNHALLLLYIHIPVKPILIQHSQLPEQLLYPMNDKLYLLEISFHPVQSHKEEPKFQPYRYSSL